MDKQAKPSHIRVLVVGDPHFQPGLLPEAKLLTNRILYFLENTEIDFVVLLGDILDTHEKVNLSAQNQAYDTICAIARTHRVYVLVGNHDMINNQQFPGEHPVKHSLYCLKEREKDNIYIVDDVRGVFFDDQYFVFCPYVPPGKFYELLKRCKRDWRKASAIFAHQEMRGCKMGLDMSLQSNSGDKWNPELPFLICGHIHNRQEIPPNIFYVGGSMQHNFGESFDQTMGFFSFYRGITNKIAIESHVSRNKKYISMHRSSPQARSVGMIYERIPIRLPRRIRLKMSIAKLEKFEIPIESITKRRDKYQIHVDDEHAEYVAFKKTKKYKELQHAGIKMLFVGKYDTPQSDDNDDNDGDFATFTTVLLQILEEEEKGKQLLLLHDKLFGEVITK